MSSRPILIKAGLPILILAVVGLATAALVNSKEPPAQDPQERKPMLVEVMEVEFQPLRYRVRSQGTVQPKTQGAMVSEVSGRVVALSAEFVAGGLVRKGDVLVEVESLDYQTGVKSAEARVYGAKVALEEEKARARVAEEDWRQFNAEQIPELGLRKPQLAKELANLRSAQAQLEQAKRDLERTKIRAPYDAIIRSKQVDLGEFVTKGSVVAQLFGTELAEVRLPITEAELGYLSFGQQSKIELSTQLGHQTFSWPATLVREEGVIDPESRFVYVVAEVVDPYQRDVETQQNLTLKFGQFVHADILSASSNSLIRLPRGALRNGRQVVLVDANNLIEFREIQIERAERDVVFVREGLKQGERVVLTPVSSLPSGSEVRTTQAQAKGAS